VIFTSYIVEGFFCKWGSIAGGNFEQAITDEKILLDERIQIRYFCRSPSAAETDEYFKKIGKFLNANYKNYFLN